VELQLARDPHLKRPNGAVGYDLAQLVNRVLKAPSATGSEERRDDWLARSLEAVRALRAAGERTDPPASRPARAK